MRTSLHVFFLHICRYRLATARKASDDVQARSALPVWHFVYAVLSTFWSWGLAALTGSIRAVMATLFPIEILCRFQFISLSLATYRAWRLQATTRILPARQLVNRVFDFA